MRLVKSNFVKVPMLVSAFSGGNGVPYADGVEMGEIHENFVLSAKEPYLIYISGDSMEPEYRSGDLLVVDFARQARHKDVVAVFYDGDFLIKEFDCSTYNPTLHSYNKKYDPIVMKQHLDYKILGVVTGFYRINK